MSRCVACGGPSPHPGQLWQRCCCAEIDPSDRPCLVCTKRGDADKDCKMCVASPVHESRVLGLLQDAMQRMLVEELVELGAAAGEPAELPESEGAAVVARLEAAGVLPEPQG